MSKIKNTAQVEAYDEPAKPSIKVHSHWNRREMVVIEVGDEKITVLGEDLIKAINNCMNVGW